MRRFIITNLLDIMILPMMACGWVGTNNYYLFSVYDRNDFTERVNGICKDNWKAYLGLPADDYYWFNAEEVIKAAQEKNDPLMVSYVQNLQKYLDCCDTEQQKLNEWNYPSKEDISACNQTLQNVRNYAAGKLKSRLRSQHALLYMRCNMLLGKHEENVTFWEQTASQFIETVYKDMMKNIYAGALYKTGQEAKAGDLFAEMGDYNSLMTIYYKKRSYVAIQREYQTNPNSKVLPFLLQDFVNNAQEADDATNPQAGGIGGKLFIRDISKNEAKQMITLCEQVIREGKSETPALWKTAKAWLEYMFGSKQQAQSDISEAINMKGTERMQNAARVIRIFIESAMAPKSQDFDDWLEAELQWMKKKSEEDYFYHQAADRITHQILVKRYEDRPIAAIGLLKAVGSYESSNYVDTMKVEGLEQFFYFTLKTPKTALDKYIKSQLNYEQFELEDLIGTKYMRLCQWDKAIQWLESIPSTFYDKQGYAVYAANRRYDIGPWLKRQWLSDKIDWSREWKIGANPKLVYAREMQKMEGELNVLTGEALKKQYYELAVRYAQASYTGDCWFLMRNSKSVIDTVRVNEVDLAGKAAQMLKKAGEPKDFLLKEKVLFAKAYVYMNPSPWYTQTWNNETYEYDSHPNPDSQAYKAFAELAEFEKKHSNETSGYVSRCDEYIQFMKAYRMH